MSEWEKEERRKIDGPTIYMVLQIIYDKYYIMVLLAKGRNC